MARSFAFRLAELSTSGTVPRTGSRCRRTYSRANLGNPAIPASATNNNRDLLSTAAEVFPIEQMERGETDLSHLLLIKNDT
jgi:hypothetical protein